MREVRKAVDETVNGAKTKVVELQTAVSTYVPTEAPRRGTTYVAAGDSIAAGDDLGGSCPHTGKSVCSYAYPQLLEAKLAASFDSTIVLRDVTCTGATSAEFLDTPRAVCEAGNAPQNIAFASNSSVATISIGADDLINWLTAYWGCVADTHITDLRKKWRENCDLYEKVIKPFESNFRQILSTATKRADFVTQYYHVFSPKAVYLYNWIAGVNGGIDLLDDSIASVAREYGAKVVVVDLRPVFATHEWGDGGSWIAPRIHCDVSCGVMGTVGVPGVHPTVAGQAAIADEIWAQMKRRLPK